MPTDAAAAPATPAAAAPAAPEPKWYDIINVGAFVDGYFNLNYNVPRPSGAVLASGSQPNKYHPFNPSTGFSLAWVGVDLSVDPDPVGAVLQLRFGPSVPALGGSDFVAPGGMGNVQNGYVQWKPGGKTGKTTLIFGKFDTIYGAEVAQSHLNINYTRGLLYNLAQPFFHTGFRADIGVTDTLTLKLMAVNGWNNTIDNNEMKTFGGQLALAPSDKMTLSAGYLGGPEGADSATCASGTSPDATGRACAPTPAGSASGGTINNPGANTRWRHMVDVVGDFKPTDKIHVMVNGDYVSDTIVGALNEDKKVSWYGAAILGRYAFTDVWAAGLRGEIIGDPDSVLTGIAANDGVMVYSGTLTIEALPHKNLVIRLDNRIDAASEDAFQTKVSGISKSQITTTLGIVAKTN